jgi:hypothetical protein
MHGADGPFVGDVPIGVAAAPALAPEPVGTGRVVYANGPLAAARATLVLVEAMLAAPHRVVVVDPIGVCWGLRLAADGRAPGIRIPVLGGFSGDHALPVDAGEAVADWLVDDVPSAVLDLSRTQAAAQARFLGSLLGRLLQRNRLPLHVVFMAADIVSDRAQLDAFVPAAWASNVGFTLATGRPDLLPDALTASVGSLVVVGKPVGPARMGLGRLLMRRLPDERAAAVAATVSALADGDACVAALDSFAPVRCVHLGRPRTYLGAPLPLGDEPTGAVPAFEPIRVTTLEARLALRGVGPGAEARSDPPTARLDDLPGLGHRERNMLEWLVRRGEEWLDDRQRADAQLAAALATLAEAVRRVRAHTERSPRG